MNSRDRYLAELRIPEAIDVPAAFGSRPVRVALVCTHRLGDTIVTLPAVGALRHSLPGISVTMIVAAEQRELLRAQPGIDDVRVLASNEQGLEDQTHDFDLVFFFRRWQGPAVPEGYPRWFSVSTDIMKGPAKLAHEHYLGVLSLLGIADLASRPRVAVPGEAAEFAERLLAPMNLEESPLVAVHPGSYYDGKRWPGDRYAEVLRWLAACYNARFVLVEGYREAELVNAITAGLEARVLRLVGQSLPNVAAVLARCTFYLGNDTGIMHLADAVDTPSVTVFGPSRRGVWGAAGPHAVSVVAEDLWHGCAACSGRHLCDRPCGRPEEQTCLRTIRADDVCCAIESLATLLGLRDRFSGLDRLRISGQLHRVPFDADGLLLVNLQTMRPLHVVHGRETVRGCLEHVAEHGSYRAAAGAGYDRDLIGALLAYRILLPGGDADEPIPNDQRGRLSAVMNHPLVWEIGVAAGTADPETRDPERAPAVEADRPSRPESRVLFVNTIPYSTYGGGERWMLNAGRALAKRGHDVLCWGLAGHRWLSDAQQFGLIGLARPVPLVLDFRTLADTVDYLRGLSVDAAVLNLDREIISLGLPLRLAGVSRVYARKGLPGKDVSGVTLWAWNRILSGIIVPSRATRDEMCAEFDLAPHQFHVIPNAVDSDRFAIPAPALDMLRVDLGLDLADRTVIAIGRLVEHKGAMDLVRAFDLVRNRLPGTKLVLVGQGPAFRDIRAEVAARDLSGCVFLLGERWDVERLLALADCFVLPSHYEGMSTAMLEAMAAGVPVVATAVSGAPEVITDGETGLLVPAADPEALAMAICKALEGGGRDSALARNARRVVATHHRFDRMVDSVEDLLGLRIAGATAGPPGNGK